MRRAYTMIAAAAIVAACSESPTGSTDDPSSMGELVITGGVPAPAMVSGPLRLAESNFNPGTITSLGGSSTTPVNLTPQTCSAGSSQSVIVTFSVRGPQGGAASFKVNTKWTYNGMTFLGSTPTTVNVPAQSGGTTTTTYPVTLTVENASGTNSGTTSIVVAPFDVASTGSPGLTNNTESSNVTIFVAFVACGDAVNTPPVLTVPNDITEEATSSAGAAVTFTITANDAEDGDISSSITCNHNSGDTFPLGETTVTCSVTDSDGATAEDSFKVNVQDTTAPTFTTFPDDQSLIATSIAGAALDLGSLTIEAKDYGPDGPDDEVSPPVDISCKVGDSDADGYVIAIGQTVEVECTATDNSQYPSPNSTTSTFDVSVGLDLSCVSGFEAPLRMSEPYSMHKRGSTIPHKFAPPCYAGGTPAVDLASGLRLVLTFQDGDVGDEVIEANDFSAGSTVWRYDGAEGHYIFNTKSVTAWSVGEWLTTVSYAGIELASTTFYLKK
ncbi:MAG TPA: HYR domain-containing protein [Gemmatimonadales bacterium]|jgi:HYR domain.